MIDAPIGGRAKLVRNNARINATVDISALAESLQVHVTDVTTVTAVTPLAHLGAGGEPAGSVSVTRCPFVDTVATVTATTTVPLTGTVTVTASTVATVTVTIAPLDAKLAGSLQ